MRARLTCAAIVAAVAAALAAANSEPVQVRVDLYATQNGRAVEDLKPEEIELLEDGVRQKIHSLEYIRPSERLFVIFVDTLHLSDASRNFRQALVRMVDAVARDDDLVALMHPEMSARDLAADRKGAVIAAILDENWTWGERAAHPRLVRLEQQWFYCFGPGAQIAEMEARWREKATLDALDGLMARLRRLRDDRKSVLLVTDGWQLFGLSRRLGAAPKTECDGDRLELAAMTSGRVLRDIIDSANRANVAFYPVQPAAGRRAEPLRELAANTDGLVAASASDTTGVVQRIASDLAAYYMLAYDSTNASADGKFRQLTVRVKRPGVLVRARRGYRAPTREELKTASPAPASPAAPAVAPPASTAVNGILHRPDEMVNPVNLASLRHVVLWKRGPSTGRDYVASEDPRLRRTDRLRLEHATTAPGAATAQMLDSVGKPMAIPVQISERPDPSGNYRWIVADVALAPLAPAEYSIELTIGDLKVNTMFQIVP